MNHELLPHEHILQARPRGSVTKGHRGTSVILYIVDHRMQRISLYIQSSQNILRRSFELVLSRTIDKASLRLMPDYRWIARQLRLHVKVSTFEITTSSLKKNRKYSYAILFGTGFLSSYTHREAAEKLQ
ncbi:hypothetical protein CERSUDRAFT_117707 [Gelatoporia subvermispora B]|uniref:Uncharacterized protein n=1 Tax=Ceriporiopsis subvermispora (strain B) TaxID=914234 RepID=M2R3W0_CERS8|nr:hypothetical protein CERSUDRAFT_117707 [Gelatoporia subvermispora B]